MHFKCISVSVCDPPQLPNYPFPSATKTLFSESVSLYLFCKLVHFYPFCLDSTYKWCDMISLLLCLNYFTQYDPLYVHSCCYKWLYSILFNSWGIVHCTCVPHLLYPFLCPWTFRLFQCLPHCKECCREHWGTCINIGVHVSFLGHVFLWMYVQEWDCKFIQ